MHQSPARTDALELKIAITVDDMLQVAAQRRIQGNRAMFFS